MHTKNLPHTQNYILSLSHTLSFSPFPSLFFSHFNFLYGFLVGSVAFSSCSARLHPAPKERLHLTHSLIPPLCCSLALSLLASSWVCLEFLVGAFKRSQFSSGNGPSMHVKMQRKPAPRAKGAAHRGQAMDRGRY